jgi:carboxypeptidase C (cathepsin A)
MKNRHRIAMLALLLGCCSLAQPADESPKPESAATPASPDACPKDDASKGDAEQPPPQAKVSVTRHQVRMGGKTIAYAATAGTMLMKNDKQEPIALFGFTAYVRDGIDARTRPILFAYNGGPGSASAWLHMGILGPQRTVLDDLDTNSRGPFRTVDKA